MSAIIELFRRAEQPFDSRFNEWEDQVSCWCQEYHCSVSESELSEIDLDLAFFVFDRVAERVVLAYALSTQPLMKRDSGRIRGFPNANDTIQKTLGEGTFRVDKGHFLGHASVGLLDINLFPHRRELNRGWSDEGKRFRKMEKFVSDHPGTFSYHRPQYDDDTWIPD